MNEKLAQVTKTVSFTSLKLAFLLSPIFFLPITTDFFSFQKQILFTILTAVSLISWLIYNLATKSVRLTLSPMLLPLILFSGSAITSAIINPPKSLDIWTSRPALLITLAVFYLLSTTLIKSSKQIRKLLNIFIAISLILSLWGILSILGIFESSSLPAFLAAKSFSPVGSLLNLVSFLIVILPISLILAFKTRTGPKKLAYFLSSGLIISAIILVGYQLLPNQTFPAVLLPKLAGWSIAIDTFKSKVLFGVGPNNFINQFTQFKPLSLNQTNFWNVGYAVSANEYLQIMTTLGLAGITTLGLLIASWLKLSKRDSGTRITATQMALNAAVATSLILALFIPFTALAWIVLVSFLSFTIVINKSKHLTKIKDVLVTINTITLVAPNQLTPDIKTKTKSAILPWLIAIPILIGLILATINISRVYAADYYFNQSLIAANQNKGNDAYNLQIKAINKAPNIDRYHTAYSNINLALANSLASQPDLTDQERQNIAQLIQQAIREARLSTQLNPNKASNWANLANIYRQLVNFAEGADQFSQAAYVRAIQLDPANPSLRLELGGLLYSQNQYDSAIDRFLEAIQLKPDFANAYYNLANAYQQQAKILEAYQAMQQAVALVPSDSPDFSKAQEELEKLQAQLPQTPAPTDEQPQPTEFTEPSPPPQAPTGFDKIDLEEPTPSPSPSPDL